MTVLPFLKPPDSASSSITPFNISFPDSDLKNLQDLLRLTPVVSASYENSLPGSDRHLGLRRDWLVEAKKYWESEFDWRKVESQLNTFPNFKTHVSDKLGGLRRTLCGPLLREA